jgi:hypothetical protein
VTASQREAPAPSYQMLSLFYVLDNWRPGSFDRTWEEEFAALGSPERAGEFIRTRNYGPRDGLALRVIRALITDPGNLRRMMPPVVLGWDGRVWAGHHRLWLAHAVPLDDVLCDVVEPGGTRSGEAAHCAPERAARLVDVHGCVPDAWGGAG